MALICDCPSPPGGRAICPDDHFAICRVINNTAYTECIPRPPDVVGEQALKNWALSIVTGNPRSYAQSLSIADTTILLSSVYESRDMRVTFKLPAARAGGHGQTVGAT